MFRGVQLRYGLTSHMNINWNPKLYVATLLAIRSDQRTLSFMIPHLGISSRRELQHSLRILSLEGKNKVKDFVFEKNWFLFQNQFIQLFLLPFKMK